MRNEVVIDCFPESVQRYTDGYAVVAVDVIRATTSAVTAVAAGRRCFPVSTLEAAYQQACKLRDPLFVGELGGNKPYGFHLNISPVDILDNREIQRPIVLLSTTGTSLIYNTKVCLASYIACFRNYMPTAEYLVNRYERIAIIGAGSRGEFREEDQMCCAWIAEKLMQEGYTPQNHRTVEIVNRWKGASPQACYVSKSVGYLKKTRQMKDLKFILSSINDLNSVYTLVNDEIMEVPMTKAENPQSATSNVTQRYSEVSH